jgi:hypothetical protein
MRIYQGKFFLMNFGLVGEEIIKEKKESLTKFTLKQFLKIVEMTK